MLRKNMPWSASSTKTASRKEPPDHRCLGRHVVALFFLAQQPLAPAARLGLLSAEDWGAETPEREELRAVDLAHHEYCIYSAL